MNVTIRQTADRVYLVSQGDRQAYVVFQGDSFTVQQLWGEGTTTKVKNLSLALGMAALDVSYEEGATT